MINPIWRERLAIGDMLDFRCGGTILFPARLIFKHNRHGLCAKSVREPARQLVQFIPQPQEKPS